MLANRPSAKSKTWTCWQRVRPAPAYVLVMVGVCLVYVAYSSKRLHEAPHMLHAADKNQHGIIKRTVVVNVAASKSRSNNATSGHVTSTWSIVATSTPTQSNVRHGTTTTNNSRTNKSPVITSLLTHLRKFTSLITNVHPPVISSPQIVATTIKNSPTPVNKSIIQQRVKIPTHTKTYKVYARCMGGRLGNQMFEYAAAYGIARRHNRSAVIHTTNFKMLWGLFANLSLPRSGPLPNMQTMGEAKYGMYDTKFDKLPESNVKLYGYFQSWKYFQKYERDLRAQFVFRETIRSKAMEYLVHVAQLYKNNSSDKNITFVGVHVRRGDRVRSQHYRVASKSYIVRAMNDFRRNFTRVHFIVCSDDLPWCKENLGQQKNVSFSDSKSPVTDFAILSLCNHTVSTVGTFSWWVGWMAGGVTTYYTRFGNTSTYIFKDVKFADHFLPNWIPMSD